MSFIKIFIQRLLFLAALSSSACLFFVAQVFGDLSLRKVEWITLCLPLFLCELLFTNGRSVYCKVKKAWLRTHHRTFGAVWYPFLGRILARFKLCQTEFLEFYSLLF